MHKTALMAAILAVLSSEAFADTTNSTSSSGAVSNSGSNSYGNVGNQTTNNMTPMAGANSNANTASTSTSSNNGNSQVIQFITPPAPSAQTLTTSGKSSQDITSVSRNSQDITSVSRSENVISGSQEQYIGYGGSYTIKNVPSVNGPPLTTANDTCMGSSSGSINGPGFGIGLGSTWTDRNCVMLKNARELWNMGMKAAAMALMCNDDSNRAALEVTGFACPQTVASRQAQAAVERQEQVARENEQLRARVSALESAKAGTTAASAEWYGRPSNPSAEAMLPPPRLRMSGAGPTPVADAAVPAATAAAAPAPAVQDAQVTITPIREPDVQTSADTAVRVVSDPAE
jgi:hypothetical protein